MPLQKVKDFILHDLDEISEKIKEKIELIQNSNIDYKSFEKFKFALGQLDNFSIRSEISDQMQQKQINNFLNTFIPNLDEIIEKNSLNNPDNIYLSLLAELNKFKDNEQNIDEKDCEKFAKRANKFLDICTDEEQKNTINEALQIIKSQTLSNQNLNKNNLSDFEKEIIRLMENGIKSDNLIDELAKKLMTSYPKDTPAAVVYKASWPDQKIIVSTLECIADKVKKADINKTALVYVGRFLADEFELSKLYNKHFSHEFREAKDARR